MLNIFKRKKASTKKRKAQKHKRSFQAAQMGRLFGAWTIDNRTLDYDLRYDLRDVRSRSRDLAINNDYYAKYLDLVCSNVVGHSGIKLQAKSFDVRRVNGEFQEVPDRLANQRIEEAWKKWGKACDVTGKMSWLDAQSMFAETAARDGEVLVRKFIDRKYPFGFALQFLECDLLDEEYNKELDNGNTIKMGVELDPLGKPVAYHLIQSSQSEDTYYSYHLKRTYIRVPADQIIHAYVQERPVQTRGYPWGVAAFTRIKNIEGYEEAAITAARVGASKMGFYTSPDGTYTGDDVEDNNPISEVEPGVFEVLPPGYEFSKFDPDYPHNEFDNFMKRTLKGISSGLGVPYVSLASDMEGVSYSSIRQGELEARDKWRTIQRWMIDNFCHYVFEEWLSAALMTQDLNLPFEKYDKFVNVDWIPRGWAWVDPSKDVKAKVEEINAGLKSKSAVISEMGGDYEDTQKQIAIEKQIEQELGLSKQEEDEPEQEMEDAEED